VTSDRTLQKIAFTRAIAEHGIVRRAMREAGLRSPTTAYEWLKAYRILGPDWMSRPRRNPKAIPNDIVDEVVALSEAQPHWGKARIARELANLHGRSVVSANGVRSVLIDAGLWKPIELRHRVDDGTPVDEERVLRQVLRGIRIDLYGDPRTAAVTLQQALREIVERDARTVHNLFREPELGSWLQRGMLQLGHALIDAGRWRSALAWLSLLDGWLADDESLPSARQRRYQELGRWYVGDGDDQWQAANQELAAPDGSVMESVSLRQADVWLETQQYLALLSRDQQGTATVERLAEAHRVIDRELPWYVTPWKRQHYRGIITHDLAVAEIQAGWPVPVILNHLRSADEDLAASGNVGMTASAWSNIARAHVLDATREPHRRRHHHNLAHAAANRAIDLVAGDRSPVLRANIWTDTTLTAATIGSLEQVDRERIHSVATLAIAHGMGRMARRLIDTPALRDLVNDYLEDLTAASERPNWHNP